MGCIVCAKDLHRDNKTGYCRKCHGEVRNRDPEYRARVVASEKRRLAQDPEAAARKRAIMLANRDMPGANEKRMAALAGSRKRALAAANAVNGAGSESRIRAGARRTATVLAWCPAHLRDQYRHLLFIKRYTASEARKMVEEQHELELARWRRSIGVQDDESDIAFLALALRKHNRTPLERVLVTAASIFDVSEEQILSADRSRHISVARYAIAATLQRSGMSTPKIAVALGRKDHTTALHWLKRADWFGRSDAKFARQMAHVVAAWSDDQQVAA